MFWDSSALIPLIVQQPWSEQLTGLDDPMRIVWWGSRLEVQAVVAEMERDEHLSAQDASTIRQQLEDLLTATTEVQPTSVVQQRAARLLQIHPLRSISALHLAAALVAYEEHPEGEGFVSFDGRLRAAAEREGFTVHP